MVPKNPSEIKALLQETLEISYEGLSADTDGDYQTALDAYRKVVMVLTDVLFYYNKATTRDAPHKRILIESKRDRYVQRVDALWASLTPELKLDYSTQVETSTLQQTNILHSFHDNYETYMNVVSLECLAFQEYSSDSLLAPMEKVQRMANTIKYGGYYTRDLYIPAGKSY